MPKTSGAVEVEYDPSQVLIGRYEHPFSGPPAGPTPEEVQREKAIRLGYKVAGDYEQDIPGYAKKLSDIYEGTARRDLARSLGDIKKSYNRRGLLSSGRREGAEYKAMGEADVALQTQKSGIRDKLAENLFELQRRARNAELGDPAQSLGNMAIASMEANLRDEISRSQAQQKLFAGLGSAMGRIGGTALGSS